MHQSDAQSAFSAKDTGTMAYSRKNKKGLRTWNFHRGIEGVQGVPRVHLNKWNF